MEFDFFVDDKPANFLSEVLLVKYGTGITFEKDDSLVKKLNSYLVKEDFKKAIKVLDELIMRNPFSIQLREARIYALNQLEKYDPACQDVDFIEKYIGSKSKYACEESGL